MQFLDTYALVEIAKGSKNYEKIVDYPFAICELTLAEFYSVILRDRSESEAEFWVKKYLPFVQSSDLATLLEAVKFKHKHKNQNLSFFDAFGYAHAIRNGGSFVTGDKAFEKMPQVNYIK
ncbi:MAG: PIN domain-containing protein [Candidatus Iainarchaeum archaeon]|uniref:PIN domain-containing protein n=1 Tax=Candidatus Iainarchaeum sp. TaxID=3101447 RepID=A0A7T9DJX1_9ARCH|nr:MAG: PIN domain-containing protein [Candidatus Diapherotrites archaeon]